MSRVVRHRRSRRSGSRVVRRKSGSRVVRRSRKSGSRRRSRRVSVPEPLAVQPDQ